MKDKSARPTDWPQLCMREGRISATLTSGRGCHHLSTTNASAEANAPPAGPTGQLLRARVGHGGLNTRSLRRSEPIWTPARTPSGPSWNYSTGPTASIGSPASERARPSIRRSSRASTSTPTTDPRASMMTSQRHRSRRSSPCTAPNNAKAAVSPTWATPPLTTETQQRPYSQPP